MEMLTESIAASCPSAFGDPTTNLFLKAAVTVVAAHCAFTHEEPRWPKDDADIIFRNTNESLAYDFIVVGAGTAGSLVASHLTHLRPSWSVLLIEAGDDPDPSYEVPSFFFSNLHGDKKDNWSYKTEPSNSSSLGNQNNASLWHKGKAMGGSSSINAMLYVRGHADNFNNWATDGNPGWNYEQLLPYFERIEKKFNLTEYEYPTNPWYEMLTLAWKKVGYKPYQNERNEGDIGTTVLRTLVRNGKRFNIAKTYLTEAKNLRILKNSKVVKLVTDVKTKKVLGVVIQHKNGVTIEISANKEIILSAGSIGTPQLLMLSGFGPNKHLTEMNIQTIQNLEVGKNLQDHLLLPLIFSTNQKTKISHEEGVSFLLEYMLKRSGPIGSLGTFDYVAFVDTKNITNCPNIQYFNTYYTINDQFGLIGFLEAVGYKKEIKHDIIELNKQSDLVFIYPSLLHPKSTGEIFLNKTVLTGKPIIRTNYFKDDSDMEIMLEAIELVQKLEDTPIFKSINLKIVDMQLEACTQFQFKTKKYWECYARHMAATLYHPVGSDKMGPEGNGSVVTHELLVHGTKNLRVIDASIMPSMPGGNVMAATLMIAEKGADIIRKHYLTKHGL